MSRWAICTLIVFLIPTIFLFQNCGRQFESSTSSSLQSYCKLQSGQESPFMSQKVALPKTFFSAQQKLQSGDDKISVTVDVACFLAKREEFTFLNNKLSIAKALRKQKKVVLPIQLTSDTDIETIREALESNECLLGLTENRLVRKSQNELATVNDPQASQQKHLAFVEHSDSLLFQAKITEPVVVAFVDSGVDYNHPELAPRMWVNDNGYHGYNFVSRNDRPLDDEGHGTHVAGIAAAVENDSTGVAGLTSDYFQIMAVKVLDSNGSGSSADVANGIYYAIENGADIINLSIESPGRNPDLEAAIQDAIAAGVVVTTATGNKAEEITSGNLYAPAYIGPSVNGVISVASVDTINASLSNFSNYSATYAEIAAPGAENSGLISGGLLSTTLGGGWTRIRGTSQATPIVTAGAAILIGYLKTIGMDYTPAGIENFIKSDGVKTRSSLEPYVNGGHTISLGFLSSNLEEYFSSGAPADTIFNGDETTGNTCILQ